MKIYEIATWAILSLGVSHAFYTFKKYKTMEENVFWFFSTALALLFNGFLNHINLSLSDDFVSNLTLIANILQFLFCASLVFYIRIPQTFIAMIISSALLILSFFH